jgi:hypothetical protein
MSNRLARIVRELEGIGVDAITTAHWYVVGGSRRVREDLESLRREHKWCFVVGCNNSGTTLVHDAVARGGCVASFVNEGQRYTRALGRGQKRGHERVWSERLSEIRLTPGERLGVIPRLVHDLRLHMKDAWQPVVLEKSTVNAARMEWLQNVFPKAVFIGVVRNGYAVAEGIKRKGNKTVERGAMHWRTVNEMMLADARNVDRYLEIKYEDFVVEPGAHISRIHEFIGVDTTPGIDGMATNSARFRNMNDDSIRRLSTEERSVIREHAEDMLVHHGYMIE